MATDSDNRQLAIFCDFENVALGVRDARYAKFDISLVLERLLVKGSIVYKKAYCDWDRYKAFKSAIHEASFELIEIPHTRQSGKNSADIRMVVDALDLCYTKQHIDTFVVISGDSDFSPLVSKLRENAKTVIGLGVKNSTSDLLINNCDEFIFYDDLVRSEAKVKKPKRSKKVAKKKRKTTGSDTESTDTESSDRESNADSADAGDAEEALSMVIATIQALQGERGGRSKVWGSMIKQTIKRRRPGFNESFYGFRTFGDLLEEAQSRGLIEMELDERSGGYVVHKIVSEE